MICSRPRLGRICDTCSCRSESQSKNLRRKTPTGTAANLPRRVMSPKHVQSGRSILRILGRRQETTSIVEATEPDALERSRSFYSSQKKRKNTLACESATFDCSTIRQRKCYRDGYEIRKYSQVRLTTSCLYLSREKGPQTPRAGSTPCCRCNRQSHWLNSKPNQNSHFNLELEWVFHPDKSCFWCTRVFENFGQIEQL